MTTTGSSDPRRTSTDYSPWWLDHFADDVTGEGAAMQGVLHGAEAVRTLVLDARALYQHQEFDFTGDYGDKGFLEEGPPVGYEGRAHQRCCHRDPECRPERHRAPRRQSPAT